MGERRELYSRYAHQDKLQYSQIFDKMVDLQDQFPTIKLWWVEAIGTKSLEDDFDRMNEERARQGLRRLNIHFNRSQSASKEDRIRALIPAYERGDVYHVTGGGMIDTLESQLKRFPKAKFDDLMDAWSGILRVGHPPRALRSDEEVQKHKKRIKILSKPRSPMTGY